MNQLGKTDGRGASARFVIFVAVTLSLSMGFLEVTLSILSQPLPGGLSSFPSVSPLLVATFCVFFFGYVLFWFLVGLPLKHFLRLETVPLAVSLAFFGASIATLTSISDPIRFPFSLDALSKLLLLFFFSLVASVGIYFSTQAVSNIPKGGNLAILFGVGTPFVLAETLVFVWLHKYALGAFFSLPSLLINFGFVLVLLLTAVLLYRTSPTISATRVLAVFLFLEFVSPLAGMVSWRAGADTRERFEQREHPIKHVVLIVVDTLRPDFITAYNPQGEPTPHIDQLAQEGILFQKAVSPSPWTLPSIASLMTGLSPKVHLTTRPGFRLPDAFPTLAEYMHDAGYVTVAFGSNPNLRTDSNLNQGFLEYQFFPEPSMGKSLGARVLERLFPDQFRRRISTSRLTELANSWLESNHEKDSFLWLHYFDPHHPYAPPPDFLPDEQPPSAIGVSFDITDEVHFGAFVPSIAERKWIKRLYGSEIRYVDQNIGRLLDTLRQLGIYEESLIILTSDHGEEFWEHEGMGHGHSLYDEQLQVPLIMKLPRSTERKRISTRVSMAGIMPTILELCGIDYDRKTLSVGSLVPLWGMKPESFLERPLISTGLARNEDRESVVFGGVKYIRTVLTHREELYDLIVDPGEHNSLAHSSVEKVEQARKILREQGKAAATLRQHYGLAGEEKRELDEETKELLKTLGYVQ